MVTIRTPQTVALRQMLLSPIESQIALISTSTLPEKYSNPLGAVYQGKVYCWNCLMKKDLSSDYIHPFFSSTIWSFTPKCCECLVELKTAHLHYLPKFTLLTDRTVYNKESKEAGEIIRWVSGEFAADYRYQVRCASDGAIEIWHRDDMSLDLQGVKWK